MKLFKNKTTKVAAIIILAGILITSLMFVYYALPNVGVPACSTDPAQRQYDPANCGDGDFGGVIFLFVGIPIVAFGLIVLIASLILRRLMRNFREERFLMYTYIVLTFIVFWALAAMYVPL